MNALTVYIQGQGSVDGGRQYRDDRNGLLMPRFAALALSAALLAPCAALAWGNPIPGLYGASGVTPPPAFSVSVSPATASISYSSTGSQTTNTVTATPVNGDGACCTYAWTRLSGSAVPGVNSPSSATTSWTGSAVSPNSYSSVWQVTATDSTATPPTATATVSVSINYSAPGAFPLNVLAKGLVIDNAMQTAIDAPSSGNAFYYPAPKIVYGTMYVDTGSYDPPSGVITLKTKSSSVLAGAGTPITVSGLTGTGSSAGNISAVTTAATANTTSTTTLTYLAQGCPGSCPGSMTINGGFGVITTPDISNFLTAGVTYVRIPIDVQQIITGMPYPTTYLGAVKSTGVPTYNSGTGIVSLTVANSLNLPAPTTTTSSTSYNGVSTIGLTSTAGVLAGASITDSTTPSAIPAGTVIGNVSGSNIVLISGANNALVNVVSMGSGDTLVITYPLTVSGATGVGSGLSALNGNFTTAAGTSGTTVTYNAGAGLPNITSISSLTLANIYAPLANSLFATPGAHGGSCGGGTYVDYVSTACTVAWNFTYLDTLVSTFTMAGIAVDLVPFVVNVQGGQNVPQPFQIMGGFTGTGSPTGNVQQDMGSGYACYGYSPSSGGTTCYEGMLLAANLALVNRYKSLAQTLYFPELYNEPMFSCSGAYTIGCTPINAFQDPAHWNQGVIDITAAIRAVDTTHWLISDCMGAGAKAQHCFATAPTSDTQTVYSFHKYDPAVFVDEGANNPINPLLVYPMPVNQVQTAIGRSGNLMSTVIPPNPVIGAPTYNASVSLTGCSPTPTWSAGSTLVGTTTSNMQACVTAGGGASSQVDYYTPTAPQNNIGFVNYAGATMATFYTNGTGVNANGIDQVVAWAQSGGHATGPAVLTVIAGEIGLNSYAIDYRSRNQYLTDLFSALATTVIPGGQTGIPPDVWSASGSKIGFRPKGGGVTYPFVSIANASSSYNSGTGLVTLTLTAPTLLATGHTMTITGATGTGADVSKLNGANLSPVSASGSTITYTIATGLTISAITSATVTYNTAATDTLNNFCLYQPGNVSHPELVGYDADYWQRIANPGSNPALACSGGQYGTPGL
jgi:hypothetical protein